jgi:Anti-sigma factor NepR
VLSDQTREEPADPAGADPEKPMIQSEESAQRHGKDVPLDEARLRQQAIGVKLRQMFDEVVSEPVPDDFLEILRRADERRAGK